MTIAQNLFSDPRFQKCKQELLALVEEYQKEIQGVRSKTEPLASHYKEAIEALQQFRSQPLWFPYLGSGFGKGAYVELQDGSIKLDFICGIGAHYGGHSSLKIIGSAIDSALSDTIMQGNLQQNGESLILFKKLTSLSHLRHCFLTTSGAMANENGLKIALQKRSPASRILAFERCFAGRTLSLSQITDKPAFREGLPSTISVDYLPFFDPSSPKDSIDRTLFVLKKQLDRYPKQHALMIFELVQGEGGFYPGDPEFFLEIAKLLRMHEIPILADEVQTFGRTPSLFAFHYFGLSDYIDICTLGKLAHVSATLFSEKMAPKPGLLSQTFTSSTSAIQAASLLLDWLAEGPFFGPQGRIAEIFHRLSSGLEKLQKSFPGQISGPFGIGAMVAFTFRNGGDEETKKFNKRLFENGLMTFIAGSMPSRIRMLPPALVVTNEEIEAALHIIEKTLQEI